MEEQQNSLTYEIIKAAVAGEKWATEKIMAYYDDYMTELATVEEKQSDGSVKSYVDEDLKQEIVETAGGDTELSAGGSGEDCRRGD